MKISTFHHLETKPSKDVHYAKYKVGLLTKQINILMWLRDTLMLLMFSLIMI